MFSTLQNVFMTLLSFGLALTSHANASMNKLNASEPLQAKLTPEQAEYLKQALQVLIESGGVDIDEQTGEAKIEESLFEILRSEKRLEIRVADPGTSTTGWGG